MQEIKVQNEEAYAQAKASKAYKELEDTINSYDDQDSLNLFESEIFSENIYLSIFVILAVLILFGVVKRLFKLLWSLLVLFILFFIFAITTNQEIPIGFDSILEYIYSLKDNLINFFKEQASKTIKNNSEEIINSLINQ